MQPRLLLALLAAVAPAAAGATPAAAAPQPSVAAGELRLPAASAFGDPGFHQVLTASARVPAAVRSSARFRLVLSLRDAGRRGQTCSSEHPLSGCATVDWSDDPGRPSVPANGVFANSVTVRLASGTRTFFLTPTGSLSRQANPFEPG